MNQYDDPKYLLAMHQGAVAGLVANTKATLVAPYQAALEVTRQLRTLSESAPSAENVTRYTAAKTPSDALRTAYDAAS